VHNQWRSKAFTKTQLGKNNNAIFKIKKNYVDTEGLFAKRNFSLFSRDKTTTKHNKTSLRSQIYFSNNARKTHLQQCKI